MKIEKHYEQNINLGNYESAKVGLTIQSDKEVKTPQEFDELNQKLFELARNTVKRELDKIKEERQKEVEDSGQ